MVPPFLKQSWVVSGIIINGLGLGMILSYPSCLLPVLKAADSPIKVDLDTASWLASIVGLSQMIGFLITSLLMDVCGRKLTYILIVLPGIFGWLLIYFSTNVTTMMIGRLSCGATCGGSLVLGAIVIGEYTSPENRGLFLTLKTTATCAGAAVMHALGHYLNWRIVTLLSVLPHVLAICIISTWPESPAWQASKGMFRGSEKSYRWLRGDSDNVKKEFDAMIEAQDVRLTLANSRESSKTKLVEFFEKFCRRDFIQPIMIMFTAFLLLEASGRHTFPAFALDILKDVSGDKSRTYMFTITMDLINITSTLFGSYLMKIVKRRTILFYSGFSSLSVLLSISLYLYLASCGIISSNRAWIPLTMLFLYFILSNLGCTSIPLALLGEIFPLAHRGIGTLLSGVSISICMMGLLKITPLLMVSINAYGTFTVFSLLMFVAIIILFMILPETKDRTLQEIEDYFNNGKFLNNKTCKADDEVKMIMLSKKPNVEIVT